MPGKKIFLLLLFIPGIAFLWWYKSYFSDSRGKYSALPPNYSSDVVSTNGMVSSASQYASEAGVEILKKGGNAIDAAVAVGFALAVTYPEAGNIGGGGFMMIRTQDSIITSIDFRETAPAASHRDMYLDEMGNYTEDKSKTGHLAAGVPGSVAGLLHALEKYGTMKRADVMEPAIRLAENGFVMEERFVESLNKDSLYFNLFPSSKKIFTNADNGGFKTGDVFIQKDLSNTLRRISEEGRDGFYSGITARLVEKEMKSGGGLITQEDLKNYKPVDRKVLSLHYKGYDIYSMPPPSSGGIALISLLEMLRREHVPDTTDQWSYVNYLHTVVECMKRVYADRSEYLGDPGFYKVPVEELLNKKYCKSRRGEIKSNKATTAEQVKPGLKTTSVKESPNTTHFSVIDKEGNMVSVTTTLNGSHGSYVVVDSAGFLLNNEMDDFSAKPGTPNKYGLIGGKANSIQPGKRMLSSMTPTLILCDGKPFMVTGSPGGSRIITIVFWSIVNVIDFRMPLNEAIDHPRIHHQWLPDHIQHEKNSLNKYLLTQLISKGHTLKEIPDYGRVDAILIDWDHHTFYGHSDRRGYGKAVGY